MGSGHGRGRFDTAGADSWRTRTGGERRSDAATCKRARATRTVKRRVGRGDRLLPWRDTDAREHLGGGDLREVDEERRVCADATVRAMVTDATVRASA